MKPPFELAPSSLYELHDRIAVAQRRFAGLLAATPPDVTVGQWTGHDVLAHVVTVMNRYTAFRRDRLAAEPRGVDAINERELGDLEGVSIDDLLVRLEQEMDTFRVMWGPASGMLLDTQVPFHGGATLDVQGALTNAMGEFVIHGFDVASAVGHPWPIEPRDGELLCRFATWTLPAYVRRSNPADLDLIVRADGLQPWTMRVRGATGDVVAGEISGSVAPTVSVSGAAAAIVMLFYGRTPPPDLPLTIDDRRGDEPTAGPFSVPDYFEEP